MMILKRVIPSFAASALLCGSAVIIGCDATDTDETSATDEYDQTSVDYDTMAEDIGQSEPVMPDQRPDDVAPSPEGTQLDPEAPQVAIGLDEFAITMPEELKPGDYEFRITNNGTAEHSFEIEGPGLERGLSARLEPGDTQRFRVSLVTGDYTVSCPVGEHDERGMERELSVTPTARPISPESTNTAREFSNPQ